MSFKKESNIKQVELSGTTGAFGTKYGHFNFQGNAVPSIRTCMQFIVYHRVENKYNISIQYL